jgi:hypothetical protein
MMKENRMCLPGIGSPEKNHICLFNLLIGVCATARTKNRRQTGDARRMSSAVATIDVVTAQYNARELLSNEVHFVGRLGAAEQSKGLATVLLDNGLQTARRKIQRLFPTSRTEDTTIPNKGLS